MVGNPLRFFPDRHYIAAAGGEGDGRRLRQHDAHAALVDAGGIRPNIEAEIDVPAEHVRYIGEVSTAEDLGGVGRALSFNASAYGRSRAITSAVRMRPPW